MADALLLTQGQAAKLLGVGEKYFRAHVRPYIKHVTIGTDWRYRRADLEHWLDRVAQSP